jgi:hypothetical protein
MVEVSGSQTYQVTLPLPVFASFHSYHPTNSQREKKMKKRKGKVKRNKYCKL